MADQSEAQDVHFEAIGPSSPYLDSDSPLAFLNKLVGGLIDASQSSLNPAMTSNLDFLRWLAAALVLVYHLRGAIFVAPMASPALYENVWGVFFALLTNCGRQAVYLFFVISGFLVGGGALADIKRGRFSVARYTIHRFARIYLVLAPALAVGLVFDLVRTHYFGINADCGGETLASYKLATVAANALSLQTLLSPELGSNTPLWSLAYEVWYYALFVAIIGCMTSSGLKSYIYALLFVAMTIFILIFNYYILAMFPLWLIGLFARCASAPIIRSKLLAWIIALLATFSYPVLIHYSPLLGSVVLACSFANLIITLMFSQSRPSGQAAKINALLAGFSFSLYLTHAPLVTIIAVFFNDKPSPILHYGPGDWKGLLLFGAYFTIAALYAFAFSRLTEERTGQFKRWLEARLLNHQRMNAAPVKKAL
ncbi:MAG: acyltransferase [Alphaproteobacteria bacterium]|nr:acyltransferase [Alphaproteobacteria bacterium]